MPRGWQVTLNGLLVLEVLAIGVEAWLIAEAWMAVLIASFLMAALGYIVHLVVPTLIDRVWPRVEDYAENNPRRFGAWLLITSLVAAGAWAWLFVPPLVGPFT